MALTALFVVGATTVAATSAPVSTTYSCTAAGQTFPVPVTVDIALLPPTAVTLGEFASASAAGAGLSDVLGLRRVIEPVQPRLVLEDGTAWLVLPEGVGYPL